MFLLVFALFGVLNVLFATRKGYNPFIWFFSAGLLGALILALLPDATDDPDKKRSGNIYGSVLIVLIFGWILYSWLTLIK